MVSADDVKRVHEAALASLTPTQRQAIGRLERATQLTNFNGRHWRENLRAVFASEAERHSCKGEA